MAVLYSGQCPVPSIHKNWVDSQTDYPFIVLVNVPTSNRTVNLFCDELYKKIDCLNIRISIGHFLSYKISLSYQCRTNDFENPFYSCYPFYIGYEKKEGKLRVKFQFTPKTDCDVKKIWSEYYIVDYLEDYYYILWGCHQVNLTANEQGAFVLMNEAHLKNSNLEDFIKSTTNTLNKLGIQYKDMIINQFNYSDCKCSSCNYLMNCETDIYLDDFKNQDFTSFHLLIIFIFAVVSFGFIMCLHSIFNYVKTTRNNRVSPMES